MVNPVPWRIQTSCGCRRLVQPSTMTLPSKRAKIHVRTGAGSKWFGRMPVQARVRSMLVIVTLETNKLVLEVCCRQKSI
jgi:hypothetical protein